MAHLRGVSTSDWNRKLLFACSGDKLEQRREQLELWLGSVIQQPRADWIGVLRRLVLIIVWAVTTKDDRYRVYGRGHKVGHTVVQISLVGNDKPSIF